MKSGGKNPSRFSNKNLVCLDMTDLIVLSVLPYYVLVQLHLTVENGKWEICISLQPVSGGEKLAFT